MEFLEFFEKKEKMCNFFRENDTEPCVNCKLSSSNNNRGLFCSSFIAKHPAEAEQIVAEWSVEHPKKTRKSELLKIFPNAEILPDECVAINPCIIDTSLRKKCKAGRVCMECRREYWLAEIEDGE